MWKIESIASKGDYFYARVPKHPRATARGYVLLHRIVMENHLGRLLNEDEIVHHRNEDKKDNSVENLELMTLPDHCRHHSSEPKFVDLICAHCGIAFQRRANQRASVKGYKQSFCSRSCNGRYQRKKYAPVV